MALTKTNLANIVEGTLPVANGGTGSTTSTGAANSILPSQTSNSGKYLTTNGTDTSWGTVTSNPGTVTSVNLTAGTAISVSGGPITSSGSITVNNTGVTSVTAGTGISVSGSTGAVTITNTSSGGFGVGQTWSNQTANRGNGTTYTNSTGLPIQVSVFIHDNSNQPSNLNITVAGSGIYPTQSAFPGYYSCITFTVPTSATYAISWNAGANFGGWWELR